MDYLQVRITWILHQGDTCGERVLLPNSFSAFARMITCCSCHVNSSQGRSWTPKRAKGAAAIFRLLSIPRLRWSTSNEDDDKVIIIYAQVSCFRLAYASTTGLLQY